MMIMPPPKSRKVVVLGHRCVGKTSIVARHVDGDFSESYSSTIRNIYTTSVAADRKHEYQLQLVDTAGLDELSVIPISLAVNVDAYILVYSVTSSASFAVVQTIYQNLLNAKGLPRFPVVLVANKIDRVDSRMVSADAGRELAARWRAAYVETSAKTGSNLTRMFDLLASRLKDVDDGLYLMSTKKKKVPTDKKKWWRLFACSTSAGADTT